MGKNSKKSLKQQNKAMVNLLLEIESFEAHNNPQIFTEELRMKISDTLIAVLNLRGELNKLTN